MRRLVIPAVVVVTLTALTVSGAYLLKGKLPISNPASAEPEQSPEHASSLAMETFDNLRLSATVPGGWRIVAGSGRFAVAAVPNRANKSGQLGATGTASSVMVCRPLPPRPLGRQRGFTSTTWRSSANKSLRPALREGGTGFGRRHALARRIARGHLVTVELAGHHIPIGIPVPALAGSDGCLWPTQTRTAVDRIGHIWRGARRPGQPDKTR